MKKSEIWNIMRVRMFILGWIITLNCTLTYDINDYISLSKAKKKVQHVFNTIQGILFIKIV